MSFSRYSAVGVAATAIHYTILVASIEWLSMPAAPAAAVGAAVGALAAYFGNRRFTFSSNAQHRRAMPAFFIVAAVSAILSAFTVWLLSTRLGVHYIVAQTLATATTLAVGYSLNRTWTFAA